MADHADVIRDYIEYLWATKAADEDWQRDEAALAALDALVDERDEEHSLSVEYYEAYVSEVALRQAAEAEVARLREAIDISIHNIGVPSPEYPAPIAHAYEVLTAALASGSEGGDG